MPTIRQFSALVGAAWLGGWLSFHIHAWLTTGMSWASDEVELMVYLLAFTVVVVGLLILPLSILAERFAPLGTRRLFILLASVVPSAIIATLILTVLLKRPFTIEQLLFRDWSVYVYFLCFALGYAVLRIRQVRT